VCFANGDTQAARGQRAYSSLLFAVPLWYRVTLLRANIGPRAGLKPMSLYAQVLATERPRNAFPRGQVPSPRCRRCIKRGYRMQW